MSVKIKLFIQQFSRLDHEEILDSLKEIGEPFSKIKDKENIEVLHNDDNLKLLNLLKKKYIKTFHPKKNGNVSISYYL